MMFSQFKRKFSLSMYKNLRIKLGEMSFYKDFVNDIHGDIYPILRKSDDCLEQVSGNSYFVKRGNVSRMICQFFPFATYEVAISRLEGEVGVCFRLPQNEVHITLRADGVVAFRDGESGESVKSVNCLENEERRLIVSCRPGAFDLYFEKNGKAEYFHTFYSESFKDSNLQSVFSDSYVYLEVSGDVAVKEMVSYVDNGISIADIRPVKYESGEVITESGRIFFTASVRMRESSYQGIFSWLPGTAEIEMTGVLFYDCGDGRWRNYVAPVILYDRERKLWYVWVSSFEHKHILAYGSFEGDPRFGVNLVRVKLMEKAEDASDISVPSGVFRDEDPDLIYDRENNRWLLAICRKDPETWTYVYVFFESDDPFEGYRYIGRGKNGAETGGSFVRVDGDLCFICGNDYNKRSEYRIYSKNGMEIADFNHPDGGFRGWGSVFSVKQGSLTRTYWLTFDRHNGSDYDWSYGNLYCFEL